LHSERNYSKSKIAVIKQKISSNIKNKLEGKALFVKFLLGTLVVLGTVSVILLVIAALDTSEPWFFLGALFAALIITAVTVFLLVLFLRSMNNGSNGSKGSSSNKQERKKKKEEMGKEKQEGQK
jgi:membrane protein implicated in regulation of membrane protease activity